MVFILDILTNKHFLTFVLLCTFIHFSLFLEFHPKSCGSIEWKTFACYHTDRVIVL